MIDKETCIKGKGTCPLQLVMVEAVDQLKFPIVPNRTNPQKYAKSIKLPNLPAEVHPHIPIHYPKYIGCYQTFQQLEAAHMIELREDVRQAECERECDEEQDIGGEEDGDEAQNEGEGSEQGDYERRTQHSDTSIINGYQFIFVLAKLQPQLIKLNSRNQIILQAQKITQIRQVQTSGRDDLWRVGLRLKIRRVNKLDKKMRAGNKIMVTQFKAKLKKIINQHPSESVRFSQFMELLTINFIRVYSKSEVAKIYKFFDNPLKLCRLTIPLSYLHLECIQESDKKKYFVVKVSPTQIYLDLTNIKQKKHTTSQCLEAFIKIMKRLYGSEKNWFRALGGLTVAVTINASGFRTSISTIMRNTSHTNCTDDIVRVFLQQSSSSDIEWKGFMKVISDQDLTKPYIPDHKLNWTSSSFASVEISKILFEHENSTMEKQSKRRLSLSSSNRNRIIQSAHTKVPSSMKKPAKTTHQQETNSKQVQFPRFFSVSAKPCVLYDKKQKFNTTLTASFRPTTNQCSVRRHRKTNTQPNFFQQMKINLKTSQPLLEGTQKEQKKQSTQKENAQQLTKNE